MKSYLTIIKKSSNGNGYVAKINPNSDSVLHLQGKVFFPDKSWTDIEEGLAEVEIIQEFEKHGIIKGRNVIAELPEGEDFIKIIQQEQSSFSTGLGMAIYIKERAYGKNKFYRTDNNMDYFCYKSSDGYKHYLKVQCLDILLGNFDKYPDVELIKIKDILFDFYYGMKSDEIIKKFKDFKLEKTLEILTHIRFQDFPCSETVFSDLIEDAIDQEILTEPFNYKGNDFIEFNPLKVGQFLLNDFNPLNDGESIKDNCYYSLSDIDYISNYVNNLNLNSIKNVAKK